MKYYNINILNTKETISVDENTILADIGKKFKKTLGNTILSAKVNGIVKTLDYKIKSDCDVELFDITSSIGFSTYQRSCLFIMFAAFSEVMGNETVVWSEHTMSKNFFCCIYDREITEEEIKLVKDKMTEIVSSDYRIEKLTVSIDDGVKLFRKYGLDNRIKSLKYLKQSEITIYKLNDYYDYLYGAIVPETSYINIFDLEKCENGFLLKFEDSANPGNLNNSVFYPKLMQIFREHNQWSKILKIDTVSALNDSIARGKLKNNILVAEALHEKKISEIADMIYRQNKNVVMIAGPSSSGKTTFSKRLSVQLRVLGLSPQIISLDDYYKNREDIPLEPDGSKNFENLSTIDVEKFNSDVTKLLNGESVETPLYNFHTGFRKSETKKLKLKSNDVLVVEGIHGINENLSYSIPKEYKFKIFISALTQLNLDEHNRISTADTRLIRRIVRDHLFRGFSARDTLEMWHKVLAGEEENIYPYQEQADIMFNSSLVYELSLLKSFAEPLLYDIDKRDGQYAEAKRLLNILNSFLAIDSYLIPQNSLMREFIGGSCF